MSSRKISSLNIPLFTRLIDAYVADATIEEGLASFVKHFNLSDCKQLLDEIRWLAAYSENELDAYVIEILYRDNFLPPCTKPSHIALIIWRNI